MRIACIQSFPIDYCLDFVNAIAPHHEVLFLAKSQHIEGREAYLDQRVELISLPWPRHRSLANIGLLRRMSQIIRSRKVDLVHFLGDDVTWLNFLPFLIGRRPITITVHDARTHPGDTESSVLPSFAIEQFYHRGTRLIVHGESIRKDLAKRSGRSPDVIDLVPHVALHRYGEIARRHGFKPRPPDGNRRLLFFGRVMAYKGLDVLLKAAASLREKAMPSLELVVAGRGPALSDLQAELRAPHVVVHDEFVPDERVAQLFLDTELVVLPYLEASQSGILAMAAAFGKPVVVTDVGELGHIVRQTGMGLVVPPSDPEALGRAITDLLTDTTLGERLSQASLDAGRSGALSPDHVAACAGQSYARAAASLAEQARRAS